jgi:hypothetical protein
MSTGRRSVPAHAASRRATPSRHRLPRTGRGLAGRAPGTAAGRTQAALAGRTPVALVSHIARTMPWGALLAGCGAGICICLAVALFRGAGQQSADIVLGIRGGFVPVMAGIAFLLHDPYRQLAAASPAPAWLTSAVRVALALPVLTVTCWVQLHLAGRALGADLRAAAGRGPGAEAASLPWIALAGEFTAWCGLALAAAAVLARTRWQDLGGVAAALCALAMLAIFGLAPLHALPAQFADMTKPDQHAWTMAWRLWAAVTPAALALAAWASRDPWLRMRAVPAGRGPRSGLG